MDGNLVWALFLFFPPDQESLAVSNQEVLEWVAEPPGNGPRAGCVMLIYNIFQAFATFAFNPKDDGRLNEDCWFRRDSSRSSCRSGNLEGFTSCDGG